jgi:hypothetical protein
VGARAFMEMRKPQFRAAARPAAPEDMAHTV